MLMSLNEVKLKMSQNQIKNQRAVSWNFPGGPVVKNPPCSAGNMGSIPGGETKIPYAVEQLNPGTTMRTVAVKNPAPTTQSNTAK